MGPVIFSRLAMFPAVLFLIVMVGCSNAKGSFPMETKLVFYLQDYLTGENVTAVPVAGIKNFTAVDFGTIIVADDAVTEGIERNSTQVGRAQGLYVNAELDGGSFFSVFSIVFTNEKYNGSTLEIQGANRLKLEHRELSVVSGTGKFRFVQGYAVLQRVYFADLNAVVKFDVTLRHHWLELDFDH